MPQPNQIPKQHLVDDPVFQKWLDQLADTVNTHSGYNGPQKLANHLDMNGYKVMNIGAPEAPSDALSSGVAEANYSAPALKPKLQSGGSSTLDTYRILNSGTQREQQSSYMNDLMSSVPSANEIFPTITNSGGMVQVSIPASMFTFADGTSVMLQGRTDLLSLPTQYTITSVSSTANLVTVSTSVATGLVAGDVVTFAGISPATYNGTFVLTSSTGGGAVLEYQLDVGTGTGTGGNVQKNGVYYYGVQKRSTNIVLLGPFAGDTLSNRLNSNFDGYQIVAVVVVTASGGQVEQSGGGGSPIVGSPTAGSFF